MVDEGHESERTEGAIVVPTPNAAALSRRALLAGAAGAVGGAILTTFPPAMPAQDIVRAPALAATPPVTPMPTPGQGTPTTALGARSTFVSPTRTPVGAAVGSSRSPLRDLTGTITPSDLHFERHHAGVPDLDPAKHTLTIHGLVDRPTVFTVDEIRRLPQVTRTHFVECSGNGRAAFKDPTPEMTAQLVGGMSSNTEWTGVPLATLLRECGVRREAMWMLAEGDDACRLTRSVPIEKAWDDALVVWAQNGEPLRPAQGFPLRLLLPGWEGNINVKWLRRLELGTRPWMTRWETSVYTDPLKDGSARQFSYVMDVKSIITSPSHPDVIAARGWRPISGLAWSGRGRVTRVEVSADGGVTWHDADLQGPSLPKAHVRFQFMWNWNGTDQLLLSKATDETGSVQVTRTQLVDARGAGTDYHFSQIVGWQVQGDGTVLYHGAT
ncbi:MAG: sulfite dehydrogenase [Gemmatimonadaceae bacterium]